MEGDFSSEPLQSSNWEVYKDALEPQPPQRLVKAWERAPVAAHAPRLHGQKIWKRVNTRSGKSKERAITDGELEKEGNGARKRMRMAGDKENIANAPWLSSKTRHDTKEFPENPYSSPKKKGRHSLAADEKDALLVPRKRTNANHLITPRKHARKGPLKPEVVVEYSLQSPVRLQEQIVLRNDEKVSDSEPAEKPPRRRKSMRRSSRRLTQDEMASLVSGIVENAIPDISFASVVAKISPVANISVENQLVGTTIESKSEEESIEVSSENTTSEITEESSNTTERNESVESAPLTTTLEPPRDSSCEKTAKSNILGTGSLIVGQEQVQDQLLEAYISIPTTIVREPVVFEETVASTVSPEPETQQPILESIEETTEKQVLSPIKSTRTPKKSAVTPKRGRITPCYTGIRRSTRVARGSSIQPESQSLQMEVHESTSEQLSNVESLEEPILGVKTVELVISPSKDTSLGDSSTSMNTQIQPNFDDAATYAPDEVTNLDTARDTISNIQAELDQQITEEILAISTHHGEPVTATINMVSEYEIGESIIDTGSLDASISTEIDSEVAELNSRSRSMRSASPEPFAEVEAELVPSLSGSISAPEEQTPELNLDANLALAGIETLEPTDAFTSTSTLIDENVDELSDDYQGTSTPHPTTTDLVEAISRNASPTKEELSDTDMLRNFLSRVKANKAAKAKTTTPKRKRSLPHSPIQVPLGTDDQLSPSSPKSKDEFDVSLPATSSPTKRRKPNLVLDDEDGTEPKSIRRSGRTRLPVKAAPLAAPSFIPVRRMGQDGDNTITLRRSEEKELAALTRINTRKNKGGAVHPQELLKKRGDEKEDPAVRQRALKDLFDEKAKKQGRKGKSVVWAEVLVQFQTMEGKKVVVEEPEKEKEREPATDEKKSTVKVGMRSKLTLGMAANGTPAPKRKMRGRT